MLLYFLSYLAVGLTTWLYCEYLFPRKESIPVEALSFCVGYLALIGIVISGIKWMIFLPFFGINFFLICKNYDCAPKTALLHSAFLTFVFLLSEELAGIGSGGTTLLSHSALDPSTILTGKLCYLVLTLLGSRFFTPHKHGGQEPAMMLLFCSMPLISAAVAVAIMILKAKQAIPPAAELMIALSQIALLAVNLVFFVLYNHLQKAHAANLELQLSIQKEHSDALHYQFLQEQAQNQRILIHDIKNHLQALNSLAEHSRNEDILAYLSKLESSLQTRSGPRLSTDPILNMLLQRTKQDCEARHIRFYCDVRDGTTDFMDAPAITALYGNLLSNAVEGADSSAGRLIDLRVTRSPEQGVVIRIVNDSDIPPKTDRFGRLTTRKQDTQAHGVGLKSIERVVQRFGGIQTMYYEQDAHKFHHIIHFPR